MVSSGRVAALVFLSEPKDASRLEQVRARTVSTPHHLHHKQPDWSIRMVFRRPDVVIGVRITVMDDRNEAISRGQDLWGTPYEHEEFSSRPKLTVNICDAHSAMRR